MTFQVFHDLYEPWKHVCVWLMKLTKNPNAAVVLCDSESVEEFDDDLEDEENVDGIDED